MMHLGASRWVGERGGRGTSCRCRVGKSIGFAGEGLGCEGGREWVYLCLREWLGSCCGAV